MNFLTDHFLRTITALATILLLVLRSRHIV